VNLHENEQRLNSNYNTVEDIIFQLTVEPDGQYRFTSVNPAFCRITGLPFEQVIGKNVNEIIPEPSLSRAEKNTCRQSKKRPSFTGKRPPITLPGN
jgi:PAS domain S-box-containing protein